jgi:ABC-type branched-subunit amino acid transport system ATPase component
MPPLLALHDVRRSFGGVPAVDGVSFEVSAGEIVALIGPNGSGKSTTANIVSGALRCDEGRLVVGPDDLTNRPAHAVARHGLARTFQIARVWGRMTVAENLLVAGTDRTDETIGAALLRRSRLRRRQVELEARVREVLEVLSLRHLEGERAEVLSGGQKRLLEFGRIMMSRARVLVLDEPLAGVNPVMVQALQDVMAGFRDDGCAVLLIEHNLQAVEETSDRVIVMATGKVIAEGSLAAVRTSEAVVTAYLGGAA